MSSEFKTTFTKITDTYMPQIENQLNKNNILFSPYSKTCILHALSAMNQVIAKDKSGLTWSSPNFDKSVISELLCKVASLQLNASASPREIYFQIRNEKRMIDKGDAKPTETWVKVMEMGIEGDGNDSLLARFGRNVVQVAQHWLVRENDEFIYPIFDGLNMTPPKWIPKGSGKIIRVVYPIIKTAPDDKSKNVVEFHIAERSDVIKNLLAHMSNNMMNETFGLAENKFKATPERKKEIESTKSQILEKASKLSLDQILDDVTFRKYISPAWTDFHSRESMIERKMRNNITKKIPKDFGNGALETMYDELSNDHYSQITTEINKHANSKLLDIEINEDTGEVENSSPKEIVTTPTPTINVINNSENVIELDYEDAEIDLFPSDPGF